MTLLVRCQEEHPACKKLSDEVLIVVIRLEQGAHCSHMVQVMPLHAKTLSSRASFKSTLGGGGSSSSNEAVKTDAVQ